MTPSKCYAIFLADHDGTDMVNKKVKLPQALSEACPEEGEFLGWPETPVVLVEKKETNEPSTEE